MTTPRRIQSGGNDSFPPNEPTIEIIVRARDGDAEAWASLDERYRSAMINIVRGSIPQEMRGRFDTEDVVQSTLVAAAKGFDNYRWMGKGSLQAWLIKLVRNRLVHRIRKDRSEKRDARLDVGLSHLAKREDFRQMEPGEALLAAEQDLQILEAVEGLSKTDRQIIEALLSGTSPKQMAEELGCSETAARSRRAEAIQRLRNIIRRKSAQS